MPEAGKLSSRKDYQMFFTKIGKVFAHLGFWSGVFKVIVGLFIAFGSSDMASNRIAAQRYFGEENSGAIIDQGTTYLLIALALGILCEISSRTNDA